MRDNDSNGIGKKIVVILLVLLLLLGAAGGVYFFLFNKEQPYQSTFKVGINSTGASVSVTATYQLEGEETSTPLLSNSGQRSLSFSGASGEKYFEAGKDIVLNSDKTFVVFTFCIKNEQLAGGGSVIRYLDVSIANDLSDSGLNYYYASIENSQVWELSVKRQMIKNNNGWSQANLAPQEDVYVDILVELVDLESEVKVTSSLESGLSINLIGTDRYIQNEWLLNSQNVALSYSGTETDLVVPDGVVEVSSEIFKDNSEITSIVFPSSVKLVGESAFENCTGLTSVTFLNNSTSTSVGENVSSTTQSTLGGEDDAVIIGDKAFKGCVNLTSIILPDNIESLSNSAFIDCSNLITVAIPGDLATVGSNVFNQSTAIEEVKFIGSKINANVASLFRPCINLSKIVIGNTVKSIANKAFKSYDSTSRKYYFTALKSVVFEDNSQCEAIGKNAFEECPIAILDFGQNSALRSVGQYAFSQTMLISVTLPEHLTTIGTSAFACPKLYEIYNLSGISLQPGTTANGQVAQNAKAVHASLSEESIYTIQDGFVTYQDENATVLHAYLGGLKTISVPVTVNKIGSYCFYYSGITAATLPSTLTNIGKKAFENCKSLTSVVLGSTSLWAKDGDIADGIVQRTIISEDDLSQDNAANALTSTYVQNSLSKYTVVDNFAIDEDSVAFSYLGSAGIASVPNVATKLAGNLFKVNCEHVYSVTIPSSVTTIGGNPFNSCMRLCEVFNYSTININSLVSNNVDVFTEEHSSAVTIGDEYVTYVKDGENILVDYVGTSLEISVPSTFSIIGRYAFYRSKVTSIIIPVEVYLIKEYAFSNSSITSAIIQTNSSSTWYFRNCAFGVASSTLGNSATLASNLKSETGAWENTKGFMMNLGAVIGYNGTETVLSVPKSATSIYANALKDKKTITSIFIPKTVRSIGNNAFECCFGLRTVTLEEGSQLTSIGSGAFASCFMLEEMFVPRGVTSIGDSAFYSCINMTSIDFEEGCAVRTIGLRCFYDCYALESVTLPNTITSIGKGAFCYCTSMESINIPTSLTQIETYCFNYCYKLKNVIWDDSSSCTVIGYTNGSGGTGRAFKECTSLESIYIPASVRYFHDGSYGNGTFQDCTSLKNVTFSPNSRLYDLGAYTFHGCTALEHIDLPSTLNTLRSCTFENCSALKSISLPDGVKTIGSYAFSGCTMLKEISFSNTLKEIGGSAFDGCRSLTEFVVPATVTTIGGFAFSGCSGITSFVFEEGTQIKTIGSWNFYSIKVPSIIIPASVTSTDSIFSSFSTYYEIINLSSVSSETLGATTSNVKINLSTSLEDRGVVAEDENGLVTITYDGVKSVVGYNGESTTVTIPNDVNKVYSFKGTGVVKKLIIPSTLQWISSDAYGLNTIIEIINLSSLSVSSSTARVTNNIEDVGTYSTNEDGFEFYSYDGKVYLSGYNGVEDTITIPSNVTDIMASAFRENKTIKSVTIPSTVESIGTYAFYYTTLEEVIFEENTNITTLSDYCFASNRSLKVVDLSNLKELITIGSNAFYSLTSLERIVFGADTKIENINYRAFSESYIKSLTIPKSVKTLGSELFGSSLTNVVFEEGSALTSISGSFNRCSKLTSISLPNSLTSIGGASFSGCTGLKSIQIPNSVTQISDSAFSGCTNLETVTLPTSLQSIGYRTFYNCKNLEQIDLPGGLKTINSEAFRGCSFLKSITIPSTVTNIYSDAFKDCTSLFEVYNLSSLTFEMGTTNNGSVALNAKAVFTNTDDHLYITDGDYVYYIDGEDSVLAGYKGTSTRLDIPNYITKISAGLFAVADSTSVYFNQISTIVLPASLKSIENNTFMYCTKLLEVYNLSANLQLTIGATTNGYVAKYAKVIHTSLSEASMFTVDGDFVYYTTGDDVVLHAYLGNETDLVLPNYITKIGRGSLFGLSLHSLTIPASVKTIEPRAFANSQYGNADYTWIESIILESQYGWASSYIDTSWGCQGYSFLDVNKLSNPEDAIIALNGQSSDIINIL